VTDVYVPLYISRQRHYNLRINLTSAPETPKRKAKITRKEYRKEYHKKKQPEIPTSPELCEKHNLR
jgi:hypothetical protein